MTDEQIPGSDPLTNPPENQNSHSEEHSGKRKRIKKRIRIKQRIRIKKKPGPKRKIKKFLTNLVWFIVISSFVATLVVMFRQLNLMDEDAKKKAPKKKQGSELLNLNAGYLFQESSPVPV